MEEDGDDDRIECDWVTWRAAGLSVQHKPRMYDYRAATPQVVV